jgi:hypothetical protein
MALRRKGGRSSPPSLPRATFTARVRVTPTEGTTGLYDRLTALFSDETIITRVLRQAVIETLLTAYGKRFADAMPDVVNTERDNSTADNAPPTVPTRTAAHYRAAAAELNQAYISGDRARIRTARDAMGTARDSMRDALQRDRGAEWGRLGEGSKFRPLLMRLAKLLTDPGMMKVESGGGRTMLGIGARSKISRMRTPSATPFLTGAATTSPYTSFFRQVEFGTGVYGQDPEGNRGTAFTLDDGNWFYGRNPKDGLHFKGAKPAHVLWQDTGLPYAKDQTDLRDTFTRLLFQYLRA